MRIIGISNKGLKKEVNEDCYLINNNVLYDSNCDESDASVAFVCDGVSNSVDSYKASRFVCEEIDKIVFVIFLTSPTLFCNCFISSVTCWFVSARISACCFNSFIFSALL